MRSLYVGILLLLLNQTAIAQCKDCVSQKVFGTPRNYELKSSELDDGTKVIGKYEMYRNMRPLVLSNVSDLENLKTRFLNSLATEYSKRFADSCNVESIQFTTDEADTLYRSTFILKITPQIHYRFALNFISSGELHYRFLIQPIPDSVLFGKIISCCKAIEIAKKDQGDPIQTVSSIDIIHMPFQHEQIDDATLVWVVESKSNPDKKGFITLFRKYVDFFSGKLLLRTKIKVPTGPPKIVSEMPVKMM